MSKIATPNYDHQTEEDYSKSNSVEVQNSAESLSTLTPPALFTQAPQEQKPEHEEIQELKEERTTFDVPSDAEDGSSDDDSDANDDESNSGFKEVISFKKEQSPTSSPIQLSETSQLKKNFQSSFGYDLSDTKVIHNSSQPAQFKAHAYAQGNEVHLGPGQEHQLPHELAHVVQQKQGKVKPTGSEGGMLINDDESLEKEADQMGQKVSQMKAFDLDNSQTHKLVKGANNQTYQFSKPDAKKKKDDGKVEKKMTLAFPDIPLGERDFKYVKASMGISTGLEVEVRVDKSLAHLPDEAGFGPKGIVIKKESPNLVKSELGEKIDLEIKNGIEVNSFGGKVGMECKMGEKSLFKGYALEFAFLEMDWSEDNIEDKIKILSSTFKMPEHSIKGEWNFGGEPHKVAAKFQVQVGIEANKGELAKQILTKFGHLFTAEVAIAGGLILGGAMAIGIACHNIHVGKDIRKRIDGNIDQILSFGHGFKAGYTGASATAGSINGLFAGLSARLKACEKMPQPVFEQKLKEKGFDSILFPAMFEAVNRYKKQALDQFKKDHDVDDDNDSNNDLKLFKEVLDASTSSQYLQNRILEI